MQAQMRIQRYPENDAYRCEGCRGLWLPLMAHEQLEERAEQIDPEQYRGSSGPEPHADVPAMRIRAADPDGGRRTADLRFESCKECYGRYHDAGGFRQVGEDPSFLLERLFGRD